MMKEVLNPRQNDEECRRIFVDSYFDLYVWFYENSDIAGFQLCYDKGNFERALTWTKENGYSHMKVDDGEGPNVACKMKPVLVADGVFDNKPIADKFKNESTLVDNAIADFVYEKIAQFQ